MDYRTFDVATFAAINEPPAYFKKEVRHRRNELRRPAALHSRPATGGFDVVRLRVQLQEKFAFPINSLIMAVLAIPFALAAGKRGAVAGVATAVGIGLLYIMVSRLSESMGNVSQLPPFLAAWAPALLFGLAGGYLILQVPTSV